MGGGIHSDPRSIVSSGFDAILAQIGCNIDWGESTAEFTSANKQVEEQYLVVPLGGDREGWDSKLSEAREAAIRAVMEEKERESSLVSHGGGWMQRIRERTEDTILVPNTLGPDANPNPPPNSTRCPNTLGPFEKRWKPRRAAPVSR